LGAWAFATVYLRSCVIGAFVVASVVAISRTIRAREPLRSRRRFVAYAALLLILLGLDGWAASAAWYAELPIEGGLPLAAGRYCVLQGGDTRLTSPFHDRLREFTALDIVKLADWGNRARRLLPRELGDYASYGAPVTSPCGGVVIAAEGALPDMPPGKPDDEHFRGNYVVVRCGGGIVKLGHLQQRSIRVGVGASVRTGETIGSIGNSGGSSEPHLHIGAFSAETPIDVVLRHSGEVPIRLDGRYLVANEVFRVN
jgi:murein DD-endopeptidase MepM/ murein hydrolase activator NlpD